MLGAAVIDTDPVGALLSRAVACISNAMPLVPARWRTLPGQALPSLACFGFILAIQSHLRAQYASVQRRCVTLTPAPRLNWRRANSVLSSSQAPGALARRAAKQRQIVSIEAALP